MYNIKLLYKIKASENIYIIFMLDGEKMLDIYNTYISEEKFNAEFNNNLKVFDINIFYNEAIEDLNALESILLTTYSGKDYWKNKGVDISAQVQSVREKLSGKTSINKTEFFFWICNALKEIKDYHLVFTLPYFNNNFEFCKHNTLYIADIVMRKSNNIYVVCKSEYNDLRVGSIISPKDENVFPTFADEFLYGVFSETPINTIDIPLNNRTVSVPIYDKNLPKRNTSKKTWTHEKIGETNIVTIHRLTAFNDQEENEMKELTIYGKELCNSKRLIIDIRGNGGGCFQYAQPFIENFNDTAVSNTNYAKLDSQASRLSEISMCATDEVVYKNKRINVLKDSTAFWSCSDYKEKGKSTFNGELYVFTDRVTGSSAEITIKCLKDNIPQCILVGENTRGCLNTGDIRYFYLPHSLVFLNIPTAIFAEIFTEGTGFLPDYWVNGDALEALKQNLLIL